MITVQININGNCILARSATNVSSSVIPTNEPNDYKVDDGKILSHIPDDGVITLAHKLLDCIKEVE